MKAKECAAAMRHAAEYLEQHPDIVVCGYMNTVCSPRVSLNITAKSFESVADGQGVECGRHSAESDYAKFLLPSGDVEIFTLYYVSEDCPYRPASVA